MGNIPAFTSSGRLTLGRACGAGRLRLGRAGRLGSPVGKGIRPEEKVRTKSKHWGKHSIFVYSKTTTHFEVRKAEAHLSWAVLSHINNESSLKQNVFLYGYNKYEYF